MEICKLTQLNMSTTMLSSMRLFHRISLVIYSWQAGRSLMRHGFEALCLLFGFLCFEVVTVRLAISPSHFGTALKRHR